MTDTPMPSRDELMKLRADGLSREKIAEYYGVALSRVKRWIRILEIPTTYQSRGKSKIRASNGIDLGVDYGLTNIEKARAILGKRMSQDYRGYLLDGKVVRLDILLQAAGIKVPEIP